MSFEYKDHTADIIIRASGETLCEAFEQAALGFYHVITDITTIDPIYEKKVALESEDIKSLLFDWIDQLIFLFDTEYFISNKVKITNFKRADNSFTLEAILIGEEFVINKHPQKTEVKAMTYSFMEIGENFVEFTLDL
ncbi:MAG: archease [Candidatus Thorarchaeota archaeon]